MVGCKISMGLRITDSRGNPALKWRSLLQGGVTLDYGVIRILQISDSYRIRIYRVQIPEVEWSSLQGEDDTDIQITDCRTLYDLQITEVQMGGLQMAVP